MQFILEKVPEKTSEELELEEFLFGKDIINDHQKNVDDEVEVIIYYNIRTKIALLIIITTIIYRF